MKPVKHLIWLAAATLTSCATNTQEPTPNLVGLSVYDALAAGTITLDNSFVIDEPPGVPRGLRGRNAEGQGVKLYIKRGDVPADMNRQWDLSQFADKEVIGFSIERDGDWVTTRR